MRGNVECRACYDSMHIDSVLIAGMAAGSVLVKRMSQEIFMKLTYILLLYQEYCLWLSSFENFIGGKIYDKISGGICAGRGSDISFGERTEGI